MLWEKGPERGDASILRDRLQLVAGQGVVGSPHFDDLEHPNRQVLLVDVSELDSLGLRPGVLREQITVDLPGLQGIAVGSTLDIGDASVEITGDCAPCRTMAGYLGEDGGQFVARAMGKRGMLGKVIRTGTVTPDDTVTLRGEPAN